MFTDGSAFTVRPKDNPLLVWRKHGVTFYLKHIVPTFNSGFQTVSVSGVFRLRGRTCKLVMQVVDGRIQQLQF